MGATNSTSRRSRTEDKRCTIHAIAFAGWRGTIIKDVPKVSAAATAVHFNALIEQVPIVLVAHRFLIDGIPKAWPTCTGIEFGFVLKQRLFADDTEIIALALVVPKLISERRLGAFVLRYFELHRRQLATQFRFG